MIPLALATSITDLPNDDDMPLLVSACQELGLHTKVCAWDDPNIDWSQFRFVVLRSTWDYTERRAEFLAWCERVATVAHLVNPLSVVRWATDKHYLADLKACGIQVVPSSFIKPNTTPARALLEFFDTSPKSEHFVVKPTIGSYSKNVKRYTRDQKKQAAEHIARLQEEGRGVIVQPYLASIDKDGETDLVYFDGAYSHAIRKSALLMEDGTVNGPTADFRTARVADADEQAIACSVLAAAVAHLGLQRPLLYGRVDLIRDDDGRPLLLEMDICEPSLSLPFHEGGAMRFAKALDKLVDS